MNITMFSTKQYDETFFKQALDQALHEDAAFNAAPDVSAALHQSSNAQFSVHYLTEKLTQRTAILAKGSEVVCCFVNDDLSEAVVDCLAQQGVKLIALRCAGYNNVDLVACKRADIGVCRVPEYSPYAVAEHAVALMLDLNRNIHRAHNRVRENDYSLDGLMGFDLHGKTVGVIGAGKIGQVFVKIMQGFGCRVLVYDPNMTLADDALENVSFDEVLKRSDVISLHCPLVPATHHLINDEALAKTKKGMMLINTSRGGLVDTHAVIRALKSHHLGYLALDVYEEEGDFFFEDLSNTAIDDDVFARLQTFPNVVITSHQAFFTKEALQRIAAVTLTNITAFVIGDNDTVQWVTS